MVLTRILFLCCLLPIAVCCGPEQKSTAMEKQDREERVKLVRNDGEKKVDVWIDGEHFTSYIYPETIEKPVLYPIKTAKGTFITRGFPIENRAGERIDHPHHIGLWLNYGDVNGLDFWNNSDAIPADKKDKYGSIVHKGITNIENGADQGKLEVEMDWVDSKGNVLMTEKTSFLFHGKENSRVIDRKTTLTAGEKDVSLKDNKEGMLGIRMARELEHPSNKPEKFTDASGIPTDVPTMNNEGITGLYRSSEGIEGDDVWGTRAKWMNLSGKIKDEKISVAILDHPDNIGYPTYWHARGYGLYAANPLGQKAMSEGKEELNYILKSGDSVTFNYRIMVLSGEEPNAESLNQAYDSFVN